MGIVSCCLCYLKSYFLLPLCNRVYSMNLFSFARWFGLTCLALSDPTSKLEFETFSQSVHIPKLYITKAEESTPSNYNLRWSGLSYTLGEVIIGSGQAHGDWQSKLSGKPLFHYGY